MAMARVLLIWACSISVISAVPLAGDEKGFISKYAAAYTQTQGGPVPYSPDECKTVEQLDKWREDKLKQIKGFVPAPFQDTAFKDVEASYQKRLASLDPTARHTPASQVEMAGHIDADTMPNPTVAKIDPQAFPAMLADASSCESITQLQGWHTAVTAYVQHSMRPEHRGFALADVQRRFLERQVQLRTRGKNMNEMLADAKHCNSDIELEAWDSCVRSFVNAHMPPDIKPRALADVQKTFNRQLAEIHSSNGDSSPEVLAKLLAGADDCKSEAELKMWRQTAALHIKTHVVPIFRIPALGDMQMRYEKRLATLEHKTPPPKKSQSGVEVVGALATASAASTTSESISKAPVMLVFLGLLIPALLSFVGAVLRARTNSGKTVALAKHDALLTEEA
jgi:hypothetical protein